VKVEILGEGRIAVIAPSFAKSKNLSDEEGIGKYTNLTGKRLIDADKLSEEQFTKLVETFDKMHTKQSTSISHVIKHKKASWHNKKDKFVLFDYEFDKFLHKHKLGLTGILDRLGLKYEKDDSKDYIRAFSIYVDDGQNPDMIIFKNLNRSAYVVWEAHLDISFSLGQLIYDYYWNFIHAKKTRKEQYFWKWVEKEFGFKKTYSKNWIEFLKIDTSNTEKIPIKTYLKERPDIIKEIFDIPENVNLIAPTGTGKTSTMINYALKNQLPVIIIQPYAVQVSQTGSKFNIAAVSQFEPYP